jgi:outer membrane protein assembly factor BamE (lipoprotein component of BamABCDE complex)
MNDLRNNKQLIGMNKTQIVNLLGEPDDEVNNDYNYYLGYSGTGINTGSLRISFNRNNVVEKINVWQG